jgi:REP element-mobilizing transposase RayT
MSVRHTIPEHDGMYFITFTCYDWLPLFEITDGYHLVYKQFDYLKSCGHSIIGYVIMPNHVHTLIHFADLGKKVNTIVGNMKRFMAYDLVVALKEQQQFDVLKKLEAGTTPYERKGGKLHRVFELSFDCKYCYGDSFIKQKLDYMHQNPVRGKWSLVENAMDYLHSSAYFYFEGKQRGYEVLWYKSIGE